MPGSNVANFKLPFCSVLASTDRNHKETKLLPRTAADQQLPVTSQHNWHGNCTEEHILPTAQTGILIHTGCF
jgi:hypothetical protein